MEGTAITDKGPPVLYAPVLLCGHRAAGRKGSRGRRPQGLGSGRPKGRRKSYMGKPPETVERKATGAKARRVLSQPGC